MYFDYWHIRRYVRLQGTTQDEVLPFGGPPFVVGGVVSLPEPVWRTAITTAIARGAPNVFVRWKWQSPLSRDKVADLLASLRAIIAEVEETRVITHPEDLSEEDHLDVDTVLNALHVIRDMLALAVQRNRAVETWSE